MASQNTTKFIAALALLTFVSRAAIGDGSNDGPLTTRAISGNATVDDISTLPDFDGDGTIGFGDFVLFASVFGAAEGDHRFDRKFDLDSDGNVGFSDFIRFAQDFGRTVPPRPPPGQNLPTNFKFAGEISDSEQLALRDELRRVQDFFELKYDIRSDAFTVLVARDSTALSSIFPGVGQVNVPPGLNGPGHPVADPFVINTGNDSMLFVIVYNQNPFSRLSNAIVHEYFHILQWTLSGFDSGSVRPYWLVEGSALWAEHIFHPTIFAEGYTPIEDISVPIKLDNAMSAETLEEFADPGKFRTLVHPIFAYAMAWVGMKHLVEVSGSESTYVEYWKQLGETGNPNTAFEAAFNIDQASFYASFKAWLPGQLIDFVRLTVPITWPGKRDNDPLSWDVDIAPVPPADMRWGGDSITLKGGYRLDGKDRALLSVRPLHQTSAGVLQ